MLVITRKAEDSIMLGDDIEIEVVDIRGGKVILGITAPRSVAVHRKEFWMKLRKEAREKAEAGAK